MLSIKIYYYTNDKQLPLSRWKDPEAITILTKVY